MVDSVNIELTSHLTVESGLGGRECGVEVQRLGVHGQRREQDVVGLGDGPAGPVLVDRADLELLEPQPALRDATTAPPQGCSRRETQRPGDQHELDLGGPLAYLKIFESR